MNQEQRILRVIESLCLADDLAFAIALKDNPGCAGHIINTVLGRSDIRVEDAWVQYNARGIDGHSVIFDLLAMDSSGNLYDVEMQRGSIKHRELMARADYYSSVMAMRTVMRGEMYMRMRERKVIFILERGAYGEEKAICTFRYKDDDGIEPEENRCVIVMANTGYDGRMREDLRDLYRDFYEPDPEKIRSAEMRDALKRVKGGDGPMTKTFKAIEELLNESRAEGLAEGREEARTEMKTSIISSMLRKNYSADTIAEMTDFPIQEIKKIAAEMKL